MIAPPQSSGFETFEELCQTIVNYLGRNDLNDSIPDFIHLAEVDLSRSLNLRAQEKDIRRTFVAGQEYIDVPEDLQVPRHILIHTDPIRMVSVVGIDRLTSIRRTSDNAGMTKPIGMCMSGDKILLAPAPGAADDYTLTYLSRLLPLSALNSSNRILKDAPDALLYGALMHSAPFIGDDQRIALWGTLYSQAKDDYKRFEWRSRTSGGPLRVQTDSAPDDRHRRGGG